MIRTKESNTFYYLSEVKISEPTPLTFLFGLVLGLTLTFIRCWKILSRLFQIIASSDWSSLLFSSCFSRHFQQISETCAQASTCKLVVAAGLEVTSLSGLKLIGSPRWISSSCSDECGECWTGVAGQIFDNLECILSQQGQTTLVRHILE